MKLDRLLRDAARRLQAEVDAVSPPDLDTARGISTRFIAQVAVAAVIVIALVVVAMNDTTEVPPAASGTTTTVAPTTTTTNHRDETDPSATPPPLAQWVVSYPPTWDRADNDLVATIDPSDTSSVTFATFPIRVGDPTCPHIPTLALQDLGERDVVISALFIAFESHLTEFWPESGLSESDFVVFDGQVDAETCSGRDDLEVWTGPTTQPSGVTMFVAFGSHVDDATRTETWAVVRSLQPQPRAHMAVGGVCVATTPGTFDLTPPPPWKPLPSDPDMAWWGTPDLWTPLDISGAFVPRKSVWWSQNFTDAGQENRPDIGVTYEKLDTPGDIRTEGNPGTNASTALDGLFMIAGHYPQDPGCWKATATYKGATLSHVFAVTEEASLQHQDDG